MATPRQILVVIDKPISPLRSDRVRRTCLLARSLAGEHNVVLGSLSSAPDADASFTARKLTVSALLTRMTRAAVLLASPDAVGHAWALRLHLVPLCVDLGEFPPAEFVARDVARKNPLDLFAEPLRLTNLALRYGDFFVCESERDRAHWLGALAAVGRIRPRLYDADPKLRRLIDTVRTPGEVDSEEVASRLPSALHRYCASPWTNSYRPGRRIVSRVKGVDLGRVPTSSR